MGCDINAHIEYTTQRGDSRPIVHHFCHAVIARDYALFAIIADVRNQKGGPQPVAMPKGLPSDLSAGARDTYVLTIDDELTRLEVDGYCTREEAARWVAERSSEYVDAGKTLVTDPDAHSASWLSYEEIQCASDRYREFAGQPSIDLAAIVGAMRSINDARAISRLVFWFVG